MAAAFLVILSAGPIQSQEKSSQDSAYLLCVPKHIQSTDGSYDCPNVEGKSCVTSKWAFSEFTTKSNVEFAKTWTNAIVDGVTSYESMTVDRGNGSYTRSMRAPLKDGFFFNFVETGACTKETIARKF